MGKNGIFTPTHLFQFNDVARINQRYHEWISAFLTGALTELNFKFTLYSLVVYTFLIPLLNSSCLSTCYDFQYLCCLF